MNKDVNRLSGLVLRGMAMGAADVVPGVSGGTIAFISGIYYELIDSLRRCNHEALICLFREGPLSAWRHINGTFLVSLLSGVMVSILTLAHAVTWALHHYPIPVWSLFFGLIIASVFHIGRQVPKWGWGTALAMLVGLVLALLIADLRPAQLPTTPWLLCAAGAVAICAMILPGISGGFLLLLMGYYSTIVGAISGLNFHILLPFATGCVAGLLLFSHLLSWLLRRYEYLTMAFLSGVLVGSLKVIWPWRQTLESIQDRHGEWIPVVQQVVTPMSYENLTGIPAQLPWAMLSCGVGVSLVLGIEWLARTQRGTAKVDS